MTYYNIICYIFFSVSGESLKIIIKNPHGLGNLGLDTVGIALK